jgi:hypothetical protein
VKHSVVSYDALTCKMQLRVCVLGSASAELKPISELRPGDNPRYTYLVYNIRFNKGLKEPFNF